MKEFSDIFALPFLAAALAGVVVFITQMVHQRATTRQALISEINMLLRDIAGYERYLTNDKHAWLQPEAVIRESPVFSRSACKVYTALLPQLHLLPRDEILRVLAFYNHYEACESLIEILFGRIKQREQSGVPLSPEQVERNKRRIGRILTGINYCRRVVPSSGISSLRELPNVYELAETELPGSEEATAKPLEGTVDRPLTDVAFVQ
jgi:hypothetical protein